MKKALICLVVLAALTTLLVTGQPNQPAPPPSTTTTGGSWAGELIFFGLTIIFAGVVAGGYINDWVKGGAIFLGFVLFASGIYSGFGERFGQAVNSAGCTSTSQRPECIQARARERASEIAQAQRDAERRAAATPLPRIPFGAVEFVKPPDCEEGWAEIPLFVGWNTTIPWNATAARTEWRDETTGDWKTKVPAHSDTVRVCVRHKGYLGDTMQIVWTRQ